MITLQSVCYAQIFCYGRVSVQVRKYNFFTQKLNVFLGNEDVDYLKIKGTDEAEHHLTINDEWRKEMDVLQSPKSDMKKSVKEDEGWQNLAVQG